MALIAIEGLSKRYGDATVVDDLSFEVRPGRVTGFLGPNGAGKTQTIKMLLGLTRPTAGSALIDGRPLADHPHPAEIVGTVLDGGGFHPARTARDALRLHARVAGATPSRVDELLERVGLADAAGKKVGRFSLGMRQRLALAQGLIADPTLLIADEPANGLDPEGILWMRDLLRELAADGKAVFVSSHLLSEMETMADDIVIIARGRLVSQGTLDELRASGETEVHVRGSDRALLCRRLHAAGLTVTDDFSGLLRVLGVGAPTVGEIAHEADVVVYHLAEASDTLEVRYLELTAGLGRGL